ncbi:MAG: PqqD family protein [Actinomycetota bacterium]
MREGLAFVEVDGEVVIYDEHTEGLHHLNPTASLVFTMCDGSATVKDLAHDISVLFRISANDVEPQIRDLVKQFRTAGLLANGSSSQ